MAEPQPPATPTPPTSPPPAATEHHVGGFGDEAASLDDGVDRRLDAIEMAGEEAAIGYRPEVPRPIAPEVRFLHVSRTIHELVTDRNRSVGIFLFVASLLFGASTALLNAPSTVEPIIPLAAIQYWCLPATFALLAMIGAFTGLILVRTRIGLIYEVSKMNELLGLPSGRVRRVNPLSIFFLMYLLVVALGAISAGLVAGMLGHRAGQSTGGALVVGVVAGLAYLAIFLATYYATILRATTEVKLAGARA